MIGDQTEFQLLLRMGLILLLGFLVGIERGWSFQKKREGKRTAGIRTFTLIALSGGVWGILSDVLGEVLLGIAFLGFVLIIVAGYYQYSRTTGLLGLTTEIAAFLTFSIGVAVIKGYIIVSVSVTILMVLLLSIKPKLHKWVKTIEPNELYSGILFLILSAILLPLLPNQGYGPLEALNPFKIWGMVVLIAGISYVGYFSMKYLGRDKGILFTSFTGALVSSLAVTITLGRFSKKLKSADVLIIGILIAIFAALMRVLLLTIIFNPVLIGILGFSVAGMAVIASFAAIWFWLNASNGTSTRQMKLRNPLQLSTALQFGLILAIVMLLTEVGKQWYGDHGIYGLALLSGMLDIDSITLSLLDMSRRDLPQSIAARGIVLATFTNTLIKGAIFTYFIGFGKAWKLLALCGVIVLCGILGMII